MGGVVRSIKKAVKGVGETARKIIPNEVADVAVKAAPFVAPFNPLLAGGMAALGSYDQTGSFGRALKSGLFTYGGGQLARGIGGAGFQKGFNPFQGADFSGGIMSGIRSLGTSPIGTQTGLKLGQYEMFGGPGSEVFKAQQEAAKLGTAGDLDLIAGPGGGIEEYLYKTDPSKLTLSQQADIVAQQVGTGTPKTGYKNILGKIVSPDATLGERTAAIKELGGKALKDIYTKDGSIDKLAVGATIAGATSYMEAKKLAEEAGLVENADEYTEEMYEADKARYDDYYKEILPDEAFGLKDGGRVKLEDGGIPSIMLEKKDYNFMDLIDEDAEEEYYKKKAEELDRKYNPQNYNDIIPKEKPMDQYMLNEIMGDKGMNTLSEDTRDKAMKMYAERAYKKGQISEDEYREIMGFKVGGRVGYKDAGFTTVKDLGIEREELGFPYDKSEYNLEDVNLLEEMPKVVVMDKEGKTRIVPENVAERLGLNVIMDSFDTEQILRSEKKADGGIMGVRNKYAMGSEVPIRKNQVGVSEMDFRQTGGFVPPIGVKEKADDIPAMLSNNEFVFTADAVRAAGGGSVNKGAKRMYDLMKSLEGKVV